MSKFLIKSSAVAFASLSLSFSNSVVRASEDSPDSEEKPAPPAESKSSSDDTDDLDAEENPLKVPLTYPLVLNDDTIKSALLHHTTGGKSVFLKFYAPWCGHCKRLEPVWQELALKMHADSEKSKCVVAKVDVTAGDSKGVGELFAIRGFPTLKLINGDKMYEYDGSRSLEGFEKYCTGGFSSSSSPSALPWNQTLLDKVVKSLTEYFEKVGQIQGFEPTILPMTFTSGVLIGVLLTMAVNGAIGGSGVEEIEPVKPVKKEGKKVD